MRRADCATEADMLTRSLKAACAAAMLFSAAPAMAGPNAAQSLHSTATVGQVSTAPPKNHINPHLTVGECQGLGGKVIPRAGCDSTFACTTTDKNGVIHEACINAAKH
jgi:hypothetical protein